MTEMKKHIYDTQVYPGVLYISAFLHILFPKAGQIISLIFYAWLRQLIFDPSTFRTGSSRSVLHPPYPPADIYASSAAA